MTIKELLKSSSKKLKNISDTPDLDSEILLSHVLKKNRSFLLSNLDKEITTKQYKDFQKLLGRRLACEPIAYITNKKEFFGLNFYVNKDVLIPRPETELIIENVIDIVENKNFCSLPKLNILDVGTGSGCIPISLAKNIPQAKIHTTDISKKALKVAKLNAKKHKVLNKIKFYEGNLLDPISKNIKFDIIIANLPYVSEKQYKNLVEDRHACPLQYEPKSALIAKNHGMDFYVKLLKQIKNYIKKEGYILFEIDPSFEKKIVLEAINILKIKNNQIKIKPDLFGLSRVLIIKL
ncbi:MAG: peptide chain release factor N(5)-glutamine methyltransferase [Parcubacteria group bacterium]|nr:peptide chain release factor N(5)-glutamine methyltransferase [Parcubacteria group bacterium]